VLTSSGCLGLPCCVKYVELPQTRRVRQSYGGLDLHPSAQDSLMRMTTSSSSSTKLANPSLNLKSNLTSGIEQKIDIGAIWSRPNATGITFNKLVEHPRPLYIGLLSTSCGGYELLVVVFATLRREGNAELSG